MSIGISFGENYSAAAWYDRSKGRLHPIDLNCEDGLTQLPMAFFYPPDDNRVLVGRVAMNSAMQYPGRVTTNIHRVLGDPLPASSVAEETRITPIESAATVLGTLVAEASEFLRETVNEAVISVPATFDHAQRAALMAAADLAGLKTVALISDVHATFLAHLSCRLPINGEEYALAYRLGDESHDLTLMTAQLAPLESGKEELLLRTLQRIQSPDLGGQHWDERLMGHLKELLYHEHDVSLDDRQDREILADNVTDAWRALARTSPVQVVGDRQLHQVDLSVEDCRAVTEDLVSTVHTQLHQAAGSGAREAITKSSGTVFLLGKGPGRFLVRDAIESALGVAPVFLSEEASFHAQGAAYWGALLVDPIPTSGESILISARSEGITDTVPHDLRVELPDATTTDDEHVSDVIWIGCGAPYGVAARREVVPGVHAQQYMEGRLLRNTPWRNKDEWSPMARIIVGPALGDDPEDAERVLSLAYDHNGILHLDLLSQGTLSAATIDTSIYSARLQCTGPSGVAGRTTVDELRERWQTTSGSARLAKVVAALGYSDWQKMVVGLPHAAEVPNGRDLRGAPLAGLHLEDKSLRWTNLAYADCSSIAMSDVSCLNADLTAVSFDGAEFDGCDFRGARLVQTCFRDARLTDVDFTGCDLRHCVLLSSVLQRCDLSRAELLEIDLRGVVLSECVLSAARLRRADLRSTVLSDAILTDADLTGAKLDASSLLPTDCRQIKLRGADLRGCELRGVDLRGADLIGADLAGANLQEANMEGADLRTANLVGADLRGANLTDTNLHYAYFQAASKWNPSGAQSETLWPEGFNPEHAGAIRE